MQKKEAAYNEHLVRRNTNMSTWPNGMPVGATVLFDGTLSSKSGLLDV